MWRAIVESPQTFRQHREDQDRSFRHSRIVGRHIEDQQNVDDHHQDVGAEYRPQRAATAPAKRRAADDDRREHLQQHGVADQRIGRAGLRADEDSGQPITAAADHIDHELDEARRHSDGARGFDVAADRVDGHAEIRALQPGPECEHENDEQRGFREKVRDCVADQKITERGRNLAAGLVHDQEGHALQDEHRGQGHDNRLHAQNRDEEAVEGARGHADRDSSRHDDQRRQRRILERGGERHVDERDHGTG